MAGDVAGAVGIGGDVLGRSLGLVLSGIFRVLCRFLSPNSPGKPRSDEELFGAYRAGDGAAFDELFRRYSGSLLRLMRRQVRTSEDATDLVQQTFLQLHRARNDFREGAPLRPWLYTIALNLRREYFRRRARRPESPTELMEREDENTRTPEAEVESAQTSLRVREALSDLPEGQQVVIELHWFEGLSFPDIAAMLDLGLSAVKVRAHRGYEQLRTELSRNVPAGSTVGA